MHRSISRQSFSSELQVIEKFSNAFLIRGFYISDDCDEKCLDDVSSIIWNKALRDFHFTFRISNLSSLKTI